MSGWSDFKERARSRPANYDSGAIGMAGRDHGAERTVRGWSLILSWEPTYERRWLLTMRWRGRLAATELDRDFAVRIAEALGARALADRQDYRWPIAKAQGFDFADPTWPDAVDLFLDAHIPNRRKPRDGDHLCWTWCEPRDQLTVP